MEIIQKISPSRWDPVAAGKIWLRAKWPLLAVVFLSVCFFSAAASYNYFVQKDDFVKWLSPDETANYIFTKLYAQTGEMQIFEKYNLIGDGIIHPRSFGSSSGILEPVSFLGIILIYGFIASVAGYGVIPFLTPAFAAVGLVFFYLLVKKIFGRKNALISVFILAVFPPYFYYSARSMFHNVLFTVLLIIGFYFIAMMAEPKRGAASRSIKAKLPSWIFSALAGLFIGLAVTTRASELIWLAPILIIIWLFYLREIGFTKLIIFLSFFFLGIMPNLFWNQILYGSPILGGYPEMNQSIRTITKASEELVKTTATGELAYHKEIIEKIKGAIFHFGFNPKQSFKMFYHYFVAMFPWLFWPSAFGFFLFLQGFSKWRKRHLAYLLSYIVVFFILLFYYGSWKFNDNPDPGSFTIGNSYTRYWLPIYLGVLPFASIFFLRFTRAIFPCWRKEPIQDSILDHTTIIGRAKSQLGALKRGFFVDSSRVVIIAVIYFFSISFILFGSEEGLIYSFQNQREAKMQQERVLALTESSSVIITKYHDKFFFPERKVIVGVFDDDNMNNNYAKLAEHLPVYYYNFTFPEKDIKYLNERKLKDVNLQIEPIEKITNDFTLYRLLKIKNL
ncbi:MAG: glycosyltransferase family 39 protein [Patescibacteria group bacterium]